MSIANYCELKVLDHVLGGTAFSQPAGIYVKLHTADPGEDCTVSGAQESRRMAVTFAAASGGAKVSNSQAQWTNVYATETYSHISLWDAAGSGSNPNITGGNPLWSGALTTPVAVTATGTFTIASGALTVTLD
jgi:hypothetical protein